MDVQGAEYKVLDGARQMLTQQRVSLIYMEIIICPTYREQRKFHDYLANLDSLGYELLDLFSPVRAQGKLIQVDAIFLSRAFEHRLRPVNATEIDG